MLVQLQGWDYWYEGVEEDWRSLSKQKSYNNHHMIIYHFDFYYSVVGFFAYHLLFEVSSNIELDWNLRLQAYFIRFQSH